MRDVYLGIVNKRVNSTYVPDHDNMDLYSVNFKEGFSYESPHIILSYAGRLPWYNYMYIPDIATYFWVDEKKALQNNRWELSAHVDVLATYKSAIMNTAGFIEYGFNANIGDAARRVADIRPAVSRTPTVSVDRFDVILPHIDMTAGTYILSAVGKSGGVRNYALDKSDVYRLCSSLNSDISAALEGKDTVEDILKYFTVNSLSQGSAMSAIKNCIWLPFARGKIGGGAAKVYLGDFDTGVTGLNVARNIYSFAGSTTLKWPVGDWQRMNVQILVYVPFVGTVAVPADQCNNCARLEIRYALDCLGGNLGVKVSADNYTLYTGSTNIAASYAIGSSSVPVQNLVSGTISAVGGTIQAATGITASSKVSGVSSAVQGAMQAITPVVQCAGGVGGSPAAGIDQTCTVTYLYYPAIGVQALQNVYGYPVFQVAKPVGGYCKTRGFSVNRARGTSAEIEAVNAYMDSGVFIE